MVRQRDARRAERGEGRPPVESGQADPAERRGAGAAALGESKRGAGKAAGQSVRAERSQRVRGVRLWVPAWSQNHAGGAGRQRQVGRVRRIDLVPRVRLHTNPSSKQIYRPTEKRFAPKCRTNLGKHRSAASSQR